MKAFSIEWHKQCLFNLKQSLDYKQDQLNRLQADCDRLKEQTLFYTIQINKAIEEGKESFDPDKYLVKRKPK